MPKTAHERARLGGRYSARDVLRYLQNPSRETGGWAREGVLTRAALEAGDLSHLKTLVSLGAKFDRISWGNTYRIEQWSEQTTREWLQIMFKHGWDGMGGHPQALLSVAEYHPGLVGMWAEHAPKSWHTRRNWLDGQLVMTHDMTPQRVLAWMGVGASQSQPDKLLLERWIGQSSEQEGAVATLVAIHDFMKADRVRRRVRGEPPFRDWPWARIQQGAVEQSKLTIAECLSNLYGPMSTDQVIELVARSNTPKLAMERARALDWKLPHPQDDKATQFLSQAIVHQTKIPNGGPTEREAFVFHLLEQGYCGNLSNNARVYVDGPNCSDSLRSSLDAGLLRKHTPQTEPAPAAARRRI